MRKKFINILKGHTPSPSIFGLIATLACLKDGSEWKEDLIEYLIIIKDFLLNQFSS